MYKLRTYLRHLLTATNQHGVHSPFVYDYLTKCLYTNPKFKVSKSENVLFKSIPYFSVQTLKVCSKDSRIENHMQKEFGLKVSQEPPFDLIYFDDPQEDVLSNRKDEIQNDSMILIKNIHSTKENSTIWKALAENEMITVSIDMFHCGALFFRKEQVKEHFKIRI